MSPEMQLQKSNASLFSSSFTPDFPLVEQQHSRHDWDKAFSSEIVSRESSFLPLCSTEPSQLDWCCLSPLNRMAPCTRLVN